MILFRMTMLFCVLTTVHVTCADFFAWRTLTHPGTHKKVHILYDMHASRIDNLVIDQGASHRAHEIMHDNRDTPDELVDCLNDLDAQAQIIRNNLPNLVKQHRDLVAMVKEGNISLISEDWQDPVALKFNVPCGSKRKLFSYFKSFVGEAKGQLRCYVSPMLGIGTSLTGAFSKNEFITIGSAYFYNADARNAAIGDHNARTVDAASLRALEELWQKPNQAELVAAEGYVHSVAIVHALVEKGYVAGGLIVSDNLAKKCETMSSVKNYLEAIRSGDCQKANDLLNESNIVDALVERPLNLRLVYEKQSGKGVAAMWRYALCGTISTMAAVSCLPWSEKQRVMYGAFVATGAAAWNWYHLWRLMRLQRKLVELPC